MIGKSLVSRQYSNPIIKQTVVIIDQFPLYQMWLKSLKKLFITFLNENKVIVENQSGFRTNHSTETTLLHSIIDYLANMEKGLIDGVVFIDFKKAFDTVDHTILLAKLERYGIRETPLKWFRSYIHQRKQVCKINNAVSNAVHINCLTYILMTFLIAYRQLAPPCFRMTPTFLVRGKHLKTLSAN